MEKGKCYSKANMGQRKKSDFYQTPEIFTKLLLQAEFFNTKKTIYEPAAGDGAITRVLQAHGFTNVISSDIANNNNFLDYDEEKFNYLITNPPYSLANEFIMKAKEIVHDKFAMFLPLNYLQGQWRYKNIFSDCVFPLKTIIVLTRMPMLSDTLREDGKFSTGMQSYAWYIWDRKYTDESPKIKWMDIQAFVYSKRDKNE